MRPIDKFILHIVHNLSPINELSDGEIKRLVDKFREEADDYNITISDEELKKAIVRFDELKDHPTVTNKDLRTYSLRQLLRIVRASPGMEGEINNYSNIPGVLYNEDGLVVYSGHNEDNCINYGRGEQWCIVRGSFGAYRYDSARKHPTFYLIRDTTLPDSDPSSFFVLVVGSDDTYKVSDRTNNDVGGRQTEWDRWEGWSFVAERFPRIANLKRLFKYVNISNIEKASLIWKKSPISINNWITDLNFDEKKNYITIRKSQAELFTNYRREDFIEKVLPKYNKLSEWVAMNPWELNFKLVLKGLESFKPQHQNSIILKVNGEGSELEIYDDDIINEYYPFITKLKILQANRINDTKCYIADNNKTIVHINTDMDDIKVSLINEEDVYKNIKLNKRTQKYLFDFPKIYLISFSLLVDTIRLNDLDFSLENLINKIKENPNATASKKVTTIQNHDIVFDYSSGIQIYKVIENDIQRISIGNEEIEFLKEDIKENKYLQKTLIQSIIKADIDDELDYYHLIKIIKGSPIENFATDEHKLFIYESEETPQLTGVFWFKLGVPTDFNIPSVFNYDERHGISNIKLRRDTAPAYSAFLRENNININDAQLELLFNRNKRTDYDVKQAFVASNPPRSNDSVLRLAIISNVIYLINTNNPGDSLKISDTSGKLLAARAPRIATTTNPGAVARPTSLSQQGRGRPPGTTNQPRPTPVGNLNITNVLEQVGLDYNNLPRPIRDRFGNLGSRSPVQNDRGASRRNNLLGTAGYVTDIINSGDNNIYILNLRNGNYVASLVLQPGNGHGILTSARYYPLNSPSDLLTALRNLNLVNENKIPINKLKKYLIFDYVHNHPDETKEVKKLLQDQLN